MNHTIDRYLNDLRKNLGHMQASERDAVLAEIEDHLTQETDRLQAADAELSPSEAAAQAIEAFGPAKEIGVAYGGGRDTIGIINQATGERILEVAAMTGKVAGKVALVGGRGLKGVLKFVGIAALVIVGVATILTVAGLILAGTLATAYHDDIAESIPRPLYDYDGRWSSTNDAETSTVTERFDVRPGVKEFWIDMGLYSEGGCGRIILTDPSGDVRYDSDQVCGGDSASRGFNFAEQGQWSIQYTFVAYTGSASVEAWYFEESN